LYGHGKIDGGKGELIVRSQTRQLYARREGGPKREVLEVLREPKIGEHLALP
jgi:hypothetical protein